MDNKERAAIWMKVAQKLQEAWNLCNELAIGDVTITPSNIKHMLDTPITAARNYARDWYLKDDIK